MHQRRDACALSRQVTSENRPSFTLLLDLRLGPTIRSKDPSVLGGTERLTVLSRRAMTGRTLFPPRDAHEKAAVNSRGANGRWKVPQHAEQKKEL